MDKAALIVLLSVAVTVIGTADGQCFCDGWFYNLTATTTPAVGKEINDTVPSTMDSNPYSVMDYRLTEFVIPLHYDLQIQSLWVFGNLTFYGVVTIWLRNEEDRMNVTLHSWGLDVVEELVTVTAADGDGDYGLAVGNVTEDYVREFLVVHLEEPLKADQVYRLRLVFAGLHNTMGFSAFVGSEYEEDGRIKYMAVTHFEPLQARRVFPCFDEPQLKATFNVSIIRPANMTSLSNMPLLESIELEDGWVEDRFQKSPKMSTYTLAFAICDFTYVEDYAGDTLIRIWVRHSVINETALAISVTPKMLTFLQKYLEVPYTLPKLDIIGVPNVHYGAMENWGLVTFDEGNLLYSAEKKDNEFTVISFLAHEISHQWFGNLVTMKWWNDIWLNEGLTTYISDIVYKEVIKPKDGWHDFYACGRFFELLGWETNPGAHPVSFGTLSATQIKTVFTRITYAKGAILTRMLGNFGSADVMRKGLKGYLEAHQYSNAEQDDLWYHFAQELKKEGIENLNIKEIMDSWTLQKGIPLLTVTRKYESRTAYVRQKIFLPKMLKHANYIKNDTKWIVPLSFTAKNSLNFDGRPQKWLYPSDDYIILTEDDGLPDADEWIIFNPALTGYYLVNYDNKNWKLLINQLIKDHTKIPAHLRMHILYSLQIFKNNNLVAQSLAYSSLEYFRKERVDWILYGGMQELVEMNRIFQPTPHYDLFKRYLRYIVKPIWRSLKTEVEFTYAKSITRGLEQNVYKLWCACGNADCLKRVYEDFKSMDIYNEDDWYDNRYIVNDDTMCSLVRKMTDSEWEDAWTHLLTYTNSSMRGASRNAFLKSFTCTSNPAQLYRLLEAAFDFDDPTFNGNERLSMFYGSVTASYFHRQLTLSVFKDHWLDMLSKCEETFIYLDILATAVTTKREVNEVKQIISCLPTEFVEGKEDRFRRIVKRMENQLESFQTTFAVHYKWLQQVTENLDPNYKAED